MHPAPALSSPLKEMLESDRDILQLQADVVERIARADPLAVILQEIVDWLGSPDAGRGATMRLSDDSTISCAAASSAEPAMPNCVHGVGIGESTGATASTPIHSRDGSRLGSVELHLQDANDLPQRHLSLLSHAAKLAGIALDFDRAEKRIGHRKLAEEEMRGISAHARCILWQGDVTGRPGWEKAMESNDSFFRWDIRVQDESAAQQILPLDLQPDESYADAWFRCRMAEDDIRMRRNAAEALLTGKQSFSQEFRCKDREGKIRWQREEVALQQLDPGRWRAFSVVTDVTDRKRAEDELCQAKEIAEAASLAKDRFLAMLSHELRTPLTPVLATVNLLESRTDLPADLRADLITIRQNVEMEARLIDDLLDLTRVNRGKVELRNETIDAHEVVRSALQTCSAEAQERQISVALWLDADRHHVWADAARLQQVFWNLLKNAIKFTPPSGRIDIRSRNVGSPARLIEVEVTDTGIGIEPELLPRLFDEFEQGERSITRRYGGLGLGLSISQALVQMQGGMLTVASDGKGRGATFKVVLPASVSPNPAAPMPTPAVKPAADTSAMILLVDDHHDTLRIMSRLLRHAGFEVVTADCVAGALKVATAQKIDLIISDIGLPDGSGLEIMQQLRGRPNVKGIALSGFGMDEDLQKSREAGFTTHLTKPVSFKVLAQSIRDVLAG